MRSVIMRWLARERRPVRGRADFRRADRPVLVVGPGAEALPEGPLRVLAATDGSEAALRAIRFAALLGPRERLIEHWSAKEAEAGFRMIRDALGKDAPGIATRVVQESVVASGIIRLARESACGLIAMGTRGRGRVASLLLGSVAQEVLRQARLPVLLSH